MQTNDITQMVQQIQSWPVPMRISLARQILESVEREPAGACLPSLPRGPSAAEIAARFRTAKPAPDDATVDEATRVHHD
jgi:hypothetical protein